MSEQETEFDWSPLGEAWWMEAAATCGATPLQARFGCCRHRGMTQAGAARLAGYGGGADGVRKAGSQAAKSTAVCNMLALAQAETGQGDDGVVGTGEARRILSRLARGSDPNVRIKALDSLAKIEDRQRADRLAGDVPQDLAEVARLILADAGIYGAPWVLQMWIADGHGDVTSAPHWPLLAPFIKNRCPELWTKYRQPLERRAEHFKTERECGFLTAFDAAGEQPEPTEAAFRAAIGTVVVVKPRVNGAAAPLPEQIEQAETAENAAA